MENNSRDKGRETVVTLTLTAVLAGVFIFLLDFMSFGFFRSILLAVFGMVIVGYLHYVLWGHAMSQEVQGEKEEEEIRQRMLEETEDDAPRPAVKSENYYQRKF